MADGTADSLRKQASAQEMFSVKIEDGSHAEVLAALIGFPGVMGVEVTDPPEGRFEIRALSGSPARRGIFGLCVERNWVLTEMIPLETRLEDIFRNLTLN